MLIVVNAVDVDAEEGVGENAVAGRIREVAVDDECCKSTEKWMPSPSTTAAVCVNGPDNAIAVSIPVDLEGMSVTCGKGS